MAAERIGDAMIVAPQPEAAEAGAEVLERGGNAVDAAIACAFVQGVVDPQMSGIGGFGSMQVYMPGRGVHDILEFYARAPLAARPDMWTDLLLGQTRDGFGFLLKGGISEIGHLAVCTPGSLKGYAEALGRYGTFDWADVMAPAITQAGRGFMVRPHVHWYWSLDQSGSGEVDTIDKLHHSRTGRDIYFRPDGTVKRPGDLVLNPDLTRTLERIARGGPDLFYRGEIAEEIAADMAAHGGLIGLDDLAAYEVSTAAPVWGEYRGHRISTSPPPASGFPMLQLLHILENFDIGALEHGSAEHVRLLAEAMKRMTVDKDRHMGDPAYVEVPVDRLIAKDYCRALAEDIRAGNRAEVSRLDKSSRDTTHISVVDARGNAVALTHTLGSPSGAITDGLGFMYNGTMARFDPRPGRAGSIAPGKRRASSAAPTIVFKDDRPFVVMGAPGGSYIAPAMAQGIMNVIDFGMSMLEAVSAPRVMAVSNTIDVSNRIRRSVTDALAEQGYAVKRSWQSYAFAALHGIRIDGGVCSGGADPQRDGMAIRVRSQAGVAASRP
ncbi:gamma-glutamyltranspeptidase/glutathione hydrolase [Azospirillum lipoferum]|uniref:gamma-glutamyltransferase n=1 Tax=Azospirillum TaxID=191 RepID=UPI0014792C6E|nr:MULTISPECIES: gamma-glutamyltransferase [Azospirillum]MCP1613679.1 gamma-glutamyltranspeptidase/glutathione hydrolase [Azospirillum lipoferum]MDW5532440.1 gamma-glutamyltransferase [Azospirillum sp. NL1]